VDHLFWSSTKFRYDFAMVVDSMAAMEDEISLDALESSIVSPSSSLDIGSSDLNAPASSSLGKRSRQLLQNEQLAALMASYHRYFSEYSETRKNVSQIIPAAVWKKASLLFRSFWNPIHVVCYIDDFRFQRELSRLQFQ